MVKIGVIGGGQLARMMIPASVNLNFDLSVLADSTETSASLVTSHVGDFRDFNQVRAFAQEVDVVTFDHEHVPIRILEGLGDLGISVCPPPEALQLTHNKIVMRETLRDIGAPQPRWIVAGGKVPTSSEIEFLGGYPLVAKKPTGGYDGKGVRVVSSPEDYADWLADGLVLLEEKVDFVRELAQLGARRPSGEWLAWDLVETTQVDGVCAEVVAPAPDLDSAVAAKAADAWEGIAEAVNVLGVLAVELFETRDGAVLVNELAMRPHNSGHVFTELSLTSQFEQHLRAVADFPLGATRTVADRGVMVNLFGGVDHDLVGKAMALFPDVKIHAYGKSPRPGRKAGHVVAVGDDHIELLGACRKVAHILQSGVYDG